MFVNISHLVLLRDSEQKCNDILSSNKTIQAMLLTQRQILEICNLWNKDIAEWSLFQIVAAWRALEYSEKGQLAPGGWHKKFKDMEKVFLLRNCPLMLNYSKELKAITSHFIKERIDEAPEPISKNGANILPYNIIL